MSVNRYSPHVLVLPEDDANRQLANGFVLNLDSSALRRVQVLEQAGGWIEVLKRFESDHIRGMHRYQKRFIVLLIDFDRDTNRLEEAKRRIPDDIAGRVFVLGAFNEPEELRRDVLRSYEEIGKAMADACREQHDGIWEHELLRHNAPELARLREHVRPILF